MKILPFAFLLFIIISCVTKPVVSQSQLEEYEIVRLATEQYKTAISKEFRIMEKPINDVIVNYYDTSILNALYDGPLKFKDITFSFKENPVTKWDEKIMRNTITTAKLILIESFEQIPSVKKPEEAKTYFSISNPIFSNDGQYALINLNYSINLPFPIGEGYIMIFKKIDGKWIYQDKFAAYVS